MTNNHEDFVVVKDLSFSYGDKEVLKNINLNISQGVMLAILGPNGGGKTTLLKIIAGLIKGYQGEVLFKCLFNSHSNKIHHNCIGYVPQKSFINLQFPATVYDTVKMGLYGVTGILGITKDESDYIDWLLEKVGISEIRHKSIKEISGGQFQRTLIARSLVAKPSLLLMDEPTVGIDHSGIIKLMELVSQIKQDLNISIVFVSHDFHVIEKSADQIVCLNKTLHTIDKNHPIALQDLSKLYQTTFEG